MNLGSVLNSESAGGKYAYGSFGELLGSAPAISTASNPLILGYAGYVYDGESGKYRTKHRSLDPQTGRWLTRDPIGFAGGDTNLYRYVLNQPLRFVDPYGLDIWYALGGGAYAAASSPGSSTGSAGSFGIGIAYDTTTGELFVITTSGSGTKASGAYAGGGFTFGTFQGTVNQFLGSAIVNSVAAGWIGSAGISQTISGSATGYSADPLGIGFGATVNSQETFTNYVLHLAGPNSCEVKK